MPLQPLIQRVREAQWVCAGCNLLNWVSRQRCRECRPYPQIHGQAPPAEGSPPRRRRQRQEQAVGPSAAPTHECGPSGKTPPPPNASRAGQPVASDAQSPSAAQKIQGLKDAMEALRKAHAPDAVLQPLHDEPKRAELEARRHLPMGQRLDSARSACKKAEAKAHQAQQAFQAAQECLDKANEEKQLRQKEFEEIENEVSAEAGASGKAEALARAVKLALEGSAGPYHIAALRAAYARYEEDENATARPLRGERDHQGGLRGRGHTLSPSSAWRSGDADDATHGPGDTTPERRLRRDAGHRDGGDGARLAGHGGAGPGDSQAPRRPADRHAGPAGPAPTGAGGLVVRSLEDARGRVALASAELAVPGAPGIGRAMMEEARESLFTLLRVDSDTTGGAATRREQVDRLEYQVPAVWPLRFNAVRKGFRAATLASWRPTCLDLFHKRDEITTSGDTDPKNAEIVVVSSSPTLAAARPCTPSDLLFVVPHTSILPAGQEGVQELE